MKGATHRPGCMPASRIRVAAASMPSPKLSPASQSPTATSQPSSICSVLKPSSATCGISRSRASCEMPS